MNLNCYSSTHFFVIEWRLIVLPGPSEKFPLRFKRYFVFVASRSSRTSKVKKLVRIYILETF